MASVLIIEDEDIIRNALTRLLERHDYSVASAPSVEEAGDAHDLTSFDVIIADLRLPGASGMEVMRLAPGVATIIMTSYASVRSAVEAMKCGALDYIAKPFDNDELLLAVRRAVKEGRLERQNAALKADLSRDYPVAGIIGDCVPMKRVFERIAKVAPTDTSVLILGESGTGKELVARALHERSRRADGPMIAVNCAAIPDSLIEAELFGHEKGAFTGAVGMRQGLVEAAHGGTLFLDEIGELPLPAQARLLRVLQEGEIRRVGASVSRRVDVRLIAATHRDLGQLVADGAFRDDLYFRINVMEICLPALRERGDDIVDLARYLLERTYKRLKSPPLRFSQETVRCLTRYPWPGNVRELENAIERAVILADSAVITPELMALPDRQDQPREPGRRTAPDLSLEDYFRQFVLEHQDSATETELARRLGISRKALWEKRQRLGIPRPRQRSVDA
ncbi:DNA-binding NtrC family response regulator [Natronocella acetinitrilica]|uniref:DNA-binding NtrC family response regulator n=1 Tax=Natronocella acetinitrilica TaxID=414046 RepID=A0AAE3KBG1_9GAMM|nr:sigma-54 dependent transcriptional regulator [Natronocella acetinitrilica]MCP1674764.1 DNA-binding NtrC family response regulator [Natronocella acetinitrilica]